MIYFNHASTTVPDMAAINIAQEYLSNYWGNPSDSNAFGKMAFCAIENSREIIAKKINADIDDIFFTSGATEANNWFINSGLTVQTSSIEHVSNLNKTLPFIEVDKNGRVILDSIKSDYEAASIMYVNNEIGVIQNIKKISEYVHNKKMIFYTDATQAFGHYKINVKEDGIDAMSVSAHKFGGIKGVGFVYLSKEVQGQIKPFLKGGHQEKNFRAGTENVFGIVQMAKAIENKYRTYKVDENIIQYISSKFFELLGNDIDIELNGNELYRSPSILNVRFKDLRAEELYEYLKYYQIYCSTGSACNSNTGLPSHVLKAIGLTDDEASRSIRFSFSASNTIYEVETVVEKINSYIKYRK